MARAFPPALVLALGGPGGPGGPGNTELALLIARTLGESYPFMDGLRRHDKPDELRRVKPAFVSVAQECRRAR